MNRFGLDDKQWPLVYTRWPRERPARAEVERYLAWADGCLDRGEPFAMITDLRDGAMLSPTERTWFFRELKSREARAKDVMVASAVVTASVIMAALINVAHLVTPPAYPFKAFRRMPDAEAWATEHLARRLGSRPPRADHPPSA